MTKVQEALRSGTTLDDMLTKYAIRAKRHPEYPNLVLLKYDQIASPFAEQIVRECRGIILDEAHDWRIVSRAFDKFFNHGEGHAAPIDWSTAIVQEKLDGSLCTLYPYDGKWHVATSGTPDAGGEINGMGQTFRQLFWATMGEQLGGDDLPPVDCEVCFYFELTSYINRIVVQHHETKLTLLGCRRMGDQEELGPQCASAWFGGSIPHVRSFDLQGWEALVRSFETMSPLSQEGYVVCDAKFNRVKVKHPGYVALHHAKDGISRRAFVEIARSGETSEVLAAFPEFAPQVEEIRDRLTGLYDHLEGAYAPIRDVASQKDFALEAVKSRLPAALFCLRGKKCESIRAYIRDMNIDNLISLLGYRTDDDTSRTPKEVLLRK